jgi:hypothetical protein
MAAREAREMQKRLFFPSDAGLVNIVAKGRMLNTAVTPLDIIRATRMYGRDVPSIKGKTTNHPNTLCKELLVPMSL